jgi:hypothetical protein
MAKNQEQALSSETTAHVLERGDIYFAYRPKVEAQVARGFEDVARLYMILSPHVKRSHRLIIIGEKHLPAVSGGGDRKSWGFVEKVASRPEEVEDELDPRCTRRRRAASANSPPPARPARGYTPSCDIAAIPIWHTPGNYRPSPVKCSGH